MFDVQPAHKVERVAFLLSPCAQTVHCPNVDTILEVTHQVITRALTPCIRKAVSVCIDIAAEGFHHALRQYCSLRIRCCTTDIGRIASKLLAVDDVDSGS